MSNFYEFDQNNSGGVFYVDDKVCHRVVIEADSSEDASSIAEGLGIYFNGCEEGVDCSCCGDRWYEGEELEFPLDFGETVFHNIQDYMQFLANRYGWTTPDIRIYYKNGEVKEIFKEAKESE